MRFGGLRNDKGEWLMGFVGYSHGGAAFMAEATALRDGLRLAWSRGY